MRGLDTNVLVRYLTGDDRRQSSAAAELIDGPGEEDPRFFVTVVALVELVWTLRSNLYGFDRRATSDVVARILGSPRFRVQEEVAVRSALELHRKGPADFSDYLIAELCTRAGCDEILTFDRTFAGHEGCTLVAR
jgi:predicted nucleic-acid-binding protein